MAELAPPKLVFDQGCPDCGERVAVLPLPIPGVEDDFDWLARDYDSFRLFMMQELAAHFPARRRWTPADMEVVIVELLAAALDRASHAVDRVQAERFLDSARRPESVRRLLKLIGWDATERIPLAILDAQPEATRERQVEGYWRRTPEAMEAARAAAPRLIAEQRRMVTLADHAEVLENHPLVALARARLVWTGGWQSVLVAARLDEEGIALDTPLHDPEAVDPGAEDPTAPTEIRGELWAAIRRFHAENRLPLPAIDATLTARRILRTMVEQYRMIGTEVFLEEAKPAPVTVTLSVQAKRGYFRSELKQALAAVFSADQGGFFEPGNLDFGAALYASDIIAAAMGVEGVAVACLNLLRRTQRGAEDRTADGFIAIAEDEYIQCANDRAHPERGTFRITVNGGEAG